MLEWKDLIDVQEILDWASTLERPLELHEALYVHNALKRGLLRVMGALQVAGHFGDQDVATQDDLDEAQLTDAGGKTGVTTWIGKAVYCGQTDPSLRAAHLERNPISLQYPE